MELLTIDKQAALLAVLDDSRKHVVSGEVDTVLVLMQKKAGGIIWKAPDSDTIANTTYLANAFVHWVYSSENR
jgi:hypothetical protein